jgi:hypothetical protein
MVGTNTLFNNPAHFHPMTGTCSRCGRVDEMEHGSDGLPYCSACIFYGMNKQCSRCRMYLPASELQQYRGQPMCPYCIQDVRDQDRKAEEYVSHENHKAEVITYVEQCERCGRDLQGRVYVWNGRKLCKSCLEDAKDSWQLERGGPMGPAQRIKVDTRRQSEKLSFIESAIGEFLMLAGMKKRPVEEIVIYHPKMQGEILGAKPMSEKAEIVKKEDNIEIEGIMTKESKGPIVPAVPVDEEKKSEEIVSVKPREIMPASENAKLAARRKMQPASESEHQDVVPIGPQDAAGAQPAKARKRRKKPKQ